MRIVTGYYAKLSWYKQHGLLENCVPVSISGKAPDGWKYPIYRKLAPSWSIWKEWHDSSDPEKNSRYIERFNQEILAKLSPETVLQELERFGTNICLFCYEKPESFCHRHLVSQWLSQHANMLIQELPITA